MTSRQQSGYLRDNQGSYIEKDSQAILQYGVDWTDWLDTGDAITTATFTVETTGTNAIQANTAVVNSGTALTTIVGGNTGTIYTVACRINTQSGYRDTRRFRIKVTDRYL
jgi:hypothetical protein